MSRLRYSLTKLRQELTGLRSRVPEQDSLDLRNLTDEELGRLEVLVVKWIAAEGDAGMLRHGAHGPDVSLSRCQCGYCQRDTSPLTEDEESELGFLFRNARTD